MPYKEGNGNIFYFYQWYQNSCNIAVSFLYILNLLFRVEITTIVLARGYDHTLTHLVFIFKGTKPGSLDLLSRSKGLAPQCSISIRSPTEKYGPRWPSESSMETNSELFNVRYLIVYGQRANQTDQLQSIRSQSESLSRLKKIITSQSTKNTREIASHKVHDNYSV